MKIEIWYTLIYLFICRDNYKSAIHTYIDSPQNIKRWFCGAIRALLGLYEKQIKTEVVFPLIIFPSSELLMAASGSLSQWVELKNRIGPIHEQIGRNNRIF